MSHYVLRKTSARAPNYAVLGPTPGALTPDGTGLRFTWGQVPPQSFTSIAAWRRWFERQGHTVEVLT